MVVALAFLSCSSDESKKHPSCSSDESKKQECNSFADREWSAERYTNWLIEIYGIVSDADEYINDKGDSVSFTHHLPATKTQQYYEMIGKYDQFRYGWSDTDYLIGKDNSPLRKQYLECRSRI
jgi:hypothetical protein